MVFHELVRMDEKLGVMAWNESNKQINGVSWNPKVAASSNVNYE